MKVIGETKKQEEYGSDYLKKKNAALDEKVKKLETENAELLIKLDEKVKKGM